LGEPAHAARIAEPDDEIDAEESPQLVTHRTPLAGASPPGPRKSSAATFTLGQARPKLAGELADVVTYLDILAHSPAPEALYPNVSLDGELRLSDSRMKARPSSAAISSSSSQMV
jgi:hypothetical protein